MDWLIAGLLALVFVLVWLILRRDASLAAKPEELAKFQVGEITAETLAYHCGYDYMKPLLIAVKGRIFDVTKSTKDYGPGRRLKKRSTGIHHLHRT